MSTPIVITEFTGQAENPHIGSGVAVGVDLYTTKNVARLSRKMDKKTGNLITSLPLYVTQGGGTSTIPAQMNYSQIIPTPLFIVGEIITGLTSGATATITADTGTVFTLNGVIGTFQVSETVKGSISNGQGTVNSYSPAETVTSSNFIFVQDEDGNVYQSVDDGENWSKIVTSSAGGKGIAIWENYLFIAYPEDIDIYGPLSTSPSITTNWWTSATGANQSALTNAVGVNHFMFVNPANNILYIANNNYIGVVRLASAVEFDPLLSSGTFVANGRQLTMVSYYNAVTIGFLPTIYLAIGVINKLNNGKADIVIWDGITNTVVNNVITCPGATGAITQLLTSNGVLYGVSNFEHGVYVINGSSAKNIDRLALRMSNRKITGEQYTTRVSSYVYPYGADFLGPELLTGGSNFPSLVQQIEGTGLYPYGVWSVNTENGVVNLKYPLSFGDINASYDRDYSIGIVRVLNDGKVMVGWRKSTEYGIDILNREDYIDNQSVVFVESSLYEVGTRSLPRTFEELEYNLIQPLNPGEEITWYWRKSLADPYTQFHQESSSTLGNNLSDIITPLPFGAVQYIQIAFSFKASPENTTSTPQVRSMILRSND